MVKEMGRKTRDIKSLILFISLGVCLCKNKLILLDPLREEREVEEAVFLSIPLDSSRGSRKLDQLVYTFLKAKSTSEYEEEARSLECHRLKQLSTWIPALLLICNV